jgi:hypothetical protein
MHFSCPCGAVMLLNSFQAIGKWVVCCKCKSRYYLPESLAYAYDTAPSHGALWYDATTGRWLPREFCPPMEAAGLWRQIGQ